MSATDVHTVPTRDPGTWQRLFEELTQGRQGQRASLEVLDAHLDEQTEADGLLLPSVDHHPDRDVLVLALSGPASCPVTLRHVVHGPEQVDLLEQDAGRLVLRTVGTVGDETLLPLSPTFRP
jgi:hypothetical protein